MKQALLSRIKKLEAPKNSRAGNAWSYMPLSALLSVSDAKKLAKYDGSPDFLQKKVLLQKAAKDGINHDYMVRLHEFFESQYAHLNKKQFKSVLDIYGKLEKVPSGLDLSLDPALLMAECGLQPDPWQARFLRSATSNTFLLTTRQAGKSTTTAIKALHQILYTPNSLVLIMSPSERQSAEIFMKMIGFYTQLGKPVPAKLASALSLELENGSRCVALPGSDKTIRGYSGVDLLIIDEAAWVPDSLYRSVRPMLAVSGGQMVALTTPFGKRGWFYEQWVKESGNNWDKMSVTADDCPRIPKEFLADEKDAMGDEWFQQEYYCKFTDVISGYFDAADIDAMFDDDIEPLFDLGVDADDEFDILDSEVEAMTF